MINVLFHYVISLDLHNFFYSVIWKRKSITLLRIIRLFRIGAPLAMNMFALTKHDSVVFLASMHLAMGALGKNLFILYNIFINRKGFATYFLFGVVKVERL